MGGGDGGDGGDGGWEALQSGAPGHDSVQLVNITPITMVYGTQITN